VGLQLDREKDKLQTMNKEEIEQFFTTPYFKEIFGHLEEEYKKCCICISEFEDNEEVRFLPCFHRFHTACIDCWLEKNSRCPLCKKDLKILLKEL
jgi:hypothetical protein